MNVRRLALLLLVLFAGQQVFAALAPLVPAQHETAGAGIVQTAEHRMGHPIAGHPRVHHATPVTGDATMAGGSDCCQADCQCLLSHCHLATLQYPVAENLSPHSSLLSEYCFSVFSPLISPLLRPPILA